jgi:hypothetical protein
MFSYSATGTNGLFTGWSSKGGTVGPPYYATAYDVAIGDFAGISSPQAAVIMSGSPNYSNFQAYALFSGSGLNTKTSFTSNAVMGKGCAAIDGDFDGKSELLITGATSTILVYKGATPALAITLDAANGSPTVSSPRTGRVASGDLNGDGAPDIIATTSWWCVNGMASNYGSTYQTGQHGDGGSKGIVFYLNTSN